MQATVVTSSSTTDLVEREWDNNIFLRPLQELRDLVYAQPFSSTRLTRGRRHGPRSNSYVLADTKGFVPIGGCRRLERTLVY